MRKSESNSTTPHKQRDGGRGAPVDFRGPRTGGKRGSWNDGQKGKAADTYQGDEDEAREPWFGDAAPSMPTTVRRDMAKLLGTKHGQQPGQASGLSTASNLRAWSERAHYHSRGPRDDHGDY